MKWYIKLLLLLMIALPLSAVFAIVGSKPSYLLIGYDNTILETNLSFALLVFLVVAVIALLVFYLFYKTAFFSRKFINWKRERKFKYANFQTRAGILALSEGKWQQAEKQFRSALSNHDQQLIAYFGAARAANHLKRHGERDQYLEQARAHIPGSELATAITLAELQLEGGQFDQCLATLNALPDRQASSNPQVVNLRRQAYSKLNDWQALVKLLPHLRKHQVVSEAELTELERAVYVNHLKTMAEQKQALVDEGNKEGLVNDLIRVWESKPDSLKQDAEVLKALVDAMLLLGADKQAEAVLSQNITASWSNELVSLYGQLNGDANKQLAQAREWLSKYADNEALQLTLGRLCLKTGDNEAAKKYFEASLKLRKNFEAYKELGKLFAAQGELEKSNEYLLLSMA